MKKLEGKVVIVTGSSKGIGAGIAKEMANEGAKVVINHRSSDNEAQKIVQEIKSTNGEAFAIQGDVSNKNDVEYLFQKTIDQFGEIDVLVNNAGVYQFEGLETITEEEFDREFKINVWGPILTTQELLKNSHGTKETSIINISSLATERPAPHCALYTATKSAVNCLSEVLSKELGNRNVRVNTVSPGLTETEGTHEIGVIGSEAEQMMVAQTPLGRIGQPEDVAKVAVFLASEESKWITGQNIAVAGGA